MNEMYEIRWSPTTDDYWPYNTHLNRWATSDEVGVALNAHALLEQENAALRTEAKKIMDAYQGFIAHANRERYLFEQEVSRLRAALAEIIAAVKEGDPQTVADVVARVEGVPMNEPTKIATFVQVIICPECDSHQEAEAVLFGGDPWWTYIHTCTECGHTIMESEWQRAGEEDEVDDFDWNCPSSQMTDEEVATAIEAVHRASEALQARTAVRGTWDNDPAARELP